MSQTPAFDRLDSQRVAFLKSLSTWSPDDLAYRPGPNQWCALDVIDHLAKVDVLLAEQIAAVERKHISLRERVLHVLVLVFMLLPARIKSPVSLPETPDSLDEAAARWSHGASQLRCALQEFPTNTTKMGVAYHPVSGALSVSMCLRFLRAHLHHHLYQIERIRRSAHVPSSLARK